MANPQLGDSQKVPYRYALNDAKSVFIPLPAGATVQVTSSDIASMSVVPDASPTIHLPGDPTDGQPDTGADATGFLVGGTKTQTGVTATFHCADASGNIIVPDVVDAVDIVPGAATTATVTLGTPVAQ